MRNACLLIGLLVLLSATVTAAKKLPVPDPILVAKSNEADWVIESFQDSKQDVYVNPVGDGHGASQLTGTSKTSAKDLTQQRVAAGARLANLLNTEMK